MKSPHNKQTIKSGVKVVVILILCLLGNVRICESKSTIDQLNV